MRPLTRLLTLLALAALCPLAALAAEDGWVDLFDGQAIKGWTQKNGTATYTVKDGTIVGKTTPGSPNSFLCTDKEYGDFELEFDVKFDPALNTGVQIRSRERGEKDTPDTDPPTIYQAAAPAAKKKAAAPKEKKAAKGGKKNKKAGAPKAEQPAPANKNAAAGRVYGPQVEIASKDSGYVYGEAMGAWRTPDDKRKPHQAIKDNEWNHFRIVAKGPRIQTWINGQPIDDLTDEPIYKTHPKGIIGLQVHGVGDKGPYEVAWKNIRIRELK